MITWNTSFQSLLVCKFFEKSADSLKGTPLEVTLSFPLAAFKILYWWENQDGGVGRHTAPPHTTRTDGKSNSKEVQHQVDKKEACIQTGRKGGDGHRGREDSHGRGRTETCGVWEERGRQSEH